MKSLLKEVKGVLFYLSLKTMQYISLRLRINVVILWFCDSDTELKWSYLSANIRP